MHYRHSYHAGNFADVFKHALLTRLVIALAAKDKPFLYLDTHAGIGVYDLRHPWARKNREHERGIARIWGRTDAPAALAPYLDAVRAENPDGGLRLYPGSPRIAHGLLRSHDRTVLTELNRVDCAALEALFARDRRVSVELMDGYSALKAHLPPAERRGLTLIDSSFDRAGEFKRLSQGLVAAHRKFATGVYALWYPMMEIPAMLAFERSIAGSRIRDILQLELSVRDAGWKEGLRGCGMLVVNPPFGFEAAAREMLDWLWRVLAENGEGGRSVRRLAPE